MYYIYLSVVDERHSMWSTFVRDHRSAPRPVETECYHTKKGYYRINPGPLELTTNNCYHGDYVSVANSGLDCAYNFEDR